MQKPAEPAEQQINVSVSQPDNKAGLVALVAFYATFFLMLRPDLREQGVGVVKARVAQVRYRWAVRRTLIEIADLPETRGK